MIEIRDYNGKGRWSRESIERRFESYSKTLGTTINNLEAQIHEENSIRWIYPMVNSVVVGIEKHDPACIELGVELIEDSDSMPFGMILKSNVARALRRVRDHLTEEQQSRIRTRVGDMLIARYMPREFIQYVKLARKIGFSEEISRVRSDADLKDGWVQHYLDRLTN